MSDNSTSLKEVVSRYLRKHPEFLTNNPDILEDLQLGHDSGVAASLIERQVELLREKNNELERQLNRLMHVASENEQLMTRLHQLTLELMATDQPKDFFAHLGKSMLEDFNADIVKVCLFDAGIAASAGENVRSISRDDLDLQQFQSQLENNHTVCGRLSETKMEFLFAEKARWVQSTALVPLGESGYDGMMAIGSSDPARFYPGMGTLFLDLLADVISCNLSNDVDEEERRSA
jgi:uncharacterized protein YigA (DUF484 family)